ncbi:MAG: c-type cytochrome [Sphingomonadaceae bacterium]|nr:c-type cytochrome [Altererythrobacter sp.]MCP5392915.1 c-type cytochrome [Sphingomonadaceae bacterium]
MIALRRLILCAALGLGLAPAAAAQPTGADIYKQRCAMCHTSKAGAKPGIGPNLAGVYGRTAASTTYNYSAAMKKKAAVKWDKASLDAFLTYPGKFIPGTKMVAQLPDKTMREKLIAYLVTLK